ncbi:MAG TPA: hypothetical protein VFG93_05935 [Gaiellaceae bacterium]|nr:hypothetical protein [Gaiellaceae bacterium]
MQHSGEVDRLIYRDEVLGIIGALSDIVVELRDIRGKKRTKAERDRIRHAAENHPRARFLRDLEELGWKELEARGVETERMKLRRRYYPPKLADG